jgi:hypothetical protein
MRTDFLGVGKVPGVEWEKELPRARAHRSYKAEEQGSHMQAFATLVLFTLLRVRITSGRCLIRSFVATHFALHLLYTLRHTRQTFPSHISVHCELHNISGRINKAVNGKWHGTSIRSISFSATIRWRKKKKKLQAGEQQKP